MFTLFVYPFAVYPGMLKTDFGQDVDKVFFENMLFKLALPLFGSSVKKSAAPSIYIASSPEVEYVTGKYFIPKGEENPKEKYYSPEIEKKLGSTARKKLKNIIEFFLGENFSNCD